MQKQLVKIKLLTDVAQIAKLNSLKPGKNLERTEEVNKKMVGTHIKLMDAIRKDYLKKDAQIRMEEEEKRLKEEEEKKNEQDRIEVMKYW